MKDGEEMIREFINGSYKYVLSSPPLVVSKVRINGVDISKYLSNQTVVGWYDVSKNSGRDVTTANGTMVLNIIATKYRLDLVTRPLTEDEVIIFFTEIIKSPKMTVQFLNPFTGQWETIRCYRGDRNAQPMFPYKIGNNLIEVYNPVTQALIEL